MRLSFLIAGCLVLGIVWFGPLPERSQYSFSAHMAIHLAVVVLAAGLIALGIVGTRLDPSDRYSAWFSPVLASVAELAVVWIWHAPRWHEFARLTMWGFVVEQASFLGCGIWLWLSALGGNRPRSRSRAAAGIVGLLLTSMHMTLLGALLALAPRPLFSPAAFCSPSFQPLADQQLGGTLMLLVGSVAYLSGGVWLASGLFKVRSQKESLS